MITTTHILIGAAATTRPHFRPWHIALGWLGGFFPDASVFLMVAVVRLQSAGDVNMWRKPDGMYWQEPWQTFSAISNSMPLWAVVALTGFVLFRFVPKHKDVGLGLLIFGAAALLHVLFDFPVHTDDAHVHFWPLTDWRFHSPVSYYQSAHYGDIVGMFEMVLDAALALYLVLRFRQWPVRVLAVVLATAPFLMRYLARMIF